MSAISNIELKGKGKYIYRAIVGILIIGVPLQLFPYLWMVSNSVKTSLEIIQYPPTIIPAIFHWDNFITTYNKFNFGRNVYITMAICLGTIVVQIPISALAAYSLSKMKPIFGRAILLFFIGTLMISSPSLLLPTFLMMHKLPIIHLNLINSVWSVILASSAWGYAVFLFKGFFDGIPNELIEAGRIEGAGSLAIFTRLILPLSKPVFSVMLLQTFMAMYGQFMLPYALLPDDRNWPLMVRIYTSTLSSPWNQVMVLLTLSTIPVIIVYILCQRYIVEGIAMTGLKG